MFSSLRSSRAKKALAAALAATFVLAASGCGQKQQQGAKQAKNSLMFHYFVSSRRMHRRLRVAGRGLHAAALRFHAAITRALAPRP